MMTKAFTTQTRVRFRHTDSSGILFFGNVFQMAHDAYEDFIAHLGWPYEQWFNNSEWAVPIRHSEAQHLRPMRASNNYDIQVLVEHLGESSFKLKYVFIDNSEIACEVSLVHAFMYLKTKSKAPMPEKFRKQLEAYRVQSLTP